MTATQYQLLIVDDEPVVRQILQEALDVPDYHLTFAATGDEALDHLQRHPVHLMLLDKNLPGLPGVEVLRRARDLQPNLGVVMITGYPSYESLLSSLRLGALDYLEKPFDDLQEVKSSVARALRRREAAPPSDYHARHADHEEVWRERMSAVAELGANLSHELKNPLTGVVGFAQVGQRRAEEADRAKELFTLIEREALRCKEILRGFLQFAQVGEPPTDPVNLDRLVREVVPSLSMTFSEASIDLVLNLDAGVPTVLGSRSELQQVVLHLLMNAIEAIGEHGHVRVDVRRAEDGWVELEVSDDGPGIPSDLHRRIFDPFFSTRQGSNHAGLGLAICYGVVRNHGGDLRMTSEEGCGASFLMRLPTAAHVERQRATR